ncbi:ATP-dependent RNA helicase HrpA [Solimonas marina]|uniref:ATP-dependent RNA helicase HrpA n=1 Tax=Solimonas marina TaxID=2714601 RepID=A0A969W762_9GAMM|nr:ATP-dependent RNA helicase HrpA [Solimonas marina]NKF21193.1 ATP-dependent RNA helicase HrpA [Solimonas marina]
MIAAAMLDTLRARLDAQQHELLARDHVGFVRLLDRARRGAKIDLARLDRDVAQARLRYENRVRLRPERIRYPEDLPVVQARDELLDAIREHQVIVVCGETGSGKTTQLPKLCLDLGRGTRGLIGHTQPRRLAARSVANRIASELDSRLGDLVGYETRFDRRVSERSMVKLMTDGILLAELGRDHLLTAYDTIIIDEAHERSLNIDFLLGWLKRVLPQRPDLKVIVTSATLDPEKLSNHFGGAPIKFVSGRTYPVEQRYRPPADDGDSEAAIAAAIDELWRGRPNGDVLPRQASPGDVLVFLPGEREIGDAARVLSGRYPRAEVLPLYSRLAATAQDKVFQTGAQPRIVLATNVAETSVTVPGIRYVVDTGTARINRFAPRTGVQQLQIEPVSQAAANQRAGRCGRLGPGICVRLYAEDDFDARPAFTDPEIRRANLAGVILSMTALGLGDVEDFPWVDAPDNRHVTDAYRVLQTLGALDDARQLTPLGRRLARLPLDPRIARIALAGEGGIAQEMILVLAAALSVQDPHEVPADAQDTARQKHAAWRHPRSDFLTLLKLWQQWRDWSAASSNRQLRRVCREHYVSFLRMEEWEAVWKQLCDLLGRREAGGGRRQDVRWTDEYLDERFAAIHEALLAGLIDHIGYKLPEKSDYQGPRNRRFRIHPGSSLVKKQPRWVMSAQLAQTTQLYARTNAAIEPEWLERVAPHLIKRTMLHPEWNATRAEVTATEHVSLLGLPLLTRARHYGSTHPAEAREIFIREALVGGDLPRKPAFLDANLKLIESIRDKEAKMRRPDLLAGDEQLHAFYDAQVPADVCTGAALKRWLHREPAAQKRLTMREADALRPGADANVESLFPDRLKIAGTTLKLSYSHEPGEEHDGVTFHIPLAQVHQLPPERFDWLVPGLRSAKLEALIRTLPQHLRRQVMPAAEYARALDERLKPDDGALLPAMCEALQQMTGVRLTADDFATDKLDAYLLPRLQLEDDKGKLLGVANTLDGLRGRFSGAARTALNQAASRDDSLKRWARQDLRDWDFDDLPDAVPLPSGARGYPALALDGARVDLRLFESREAAATAHRGGVLALLLQRMPERTRDIGKGTRSKLGLLAVSFKLDVERVAQQLGTRAAAARLLDDDEPIRTRAAFQAALERRAAFSIDALARLDTLVGWLQTAQALRKTLDADAKAWPTPVADMRAQLDSLFAPDFVAAIPDAHWSRIAVYLRALQIRLERLRNKPQRDEDLTRQVAPFQAQLPDLSHPARWLLEEWRVALFAQELKAVGRPSAQVLRDALVENKR